MKKVLNHSPKAPVLVESDCRNDAAAEDAPGSGSGLEAMQDTYRQLLRRNWQGQHKPVRQWGPPGPAVLMSSTVPFPHDQKSRVLPIFR